MYTIQDKLSADVKKYAHHKEIMAKMGERIDQNSSLPTARTSA